MSAIGEAVRTSMVLEAAENYARADDPLMTRHRPESRGNPVDSFYDDEDFWSGSYLEDPLDPASVYPNFDLACARLSTGLVVEQDQCSSIGIDISDAGLQFLESTTADDVAFPEEDAFPLNPDDVTL